MHRLFDVFQSGVVGIQFRLLPMEGMTPWLVNSTPDVMTNCFSKLAKAVGQVSNAGGQMAKAVAKAGPKMKELKDLLDKLVQDSDEDDE